MKTLAIIPARSGSKRIPHKNILNFCGKPIIAYSIEVALSSGQFDEVMVSTDDEEIASIAKKFGASVPFLRSPATSDDQAGLVEVLEEVVECYRSQYNKTFELVCCILATAPLIRPADISEAKELLLLRGFDSTFPVVRFSYPILRALRIRNGCAVMMWPEYYEKRSQDMEPAFHDSGQFYWLRPEVCFPQKRIFTNNSGVIELPESQVQDIDSLEDWEICEMKYRLLFKNIKEFR